MKFVLNILSLAIFAMFAWLVVFLAVPQVRELARPCRQPIKYDIGEVDPRFRLSRDELITVMLEAEKPWEAPTGRNLFQYTPSASFKINLVYDYRQETSDKQKQLNDAIEKDLSSYSELKNRYDTLTADYKQRLTAYNAEVRKWNQQGGASQEDYTRLEKERVALNAIADQINSLAGRLNSLSNSTSAKVDEYNSQAGEVFDKGEYTREGRKTAITIYEFQNKPELTLTLVHELGHALGIEHVENPKSVMYYLLEEQSNKNIVLTAEDKAGLAQACRLPL